MEGWVPPKTPDPIVWIVGDWRQAEFGDAVARVKSRARCSLFDDAGAALVGMRGIESAAAPTAILIVQSRPGQIGRGDVERLHAAAPLARLVGLIGTWCDGEQRRTLWPGVALTPMNVSRYRLEEELGLNGCSGPLVTPLPRTMTASERLEAKMAALARSGGRGMAVVVVVSSQRENYDAIADMLRGLGVESSWQREAGGAGGEVDVVVFDGWEQVSAPLAGKNGIEPVRLVLMDFPRAEDFERAEKEGIAAVLARPVMMADLVAAFGNAESHEAGPLACAAGLCESGSVRDGTPQRAFPTVSAR